MDVLPFLSVLVLIFSFILLTEIFKLKREVRKIAKISSMNKKSLNKLKEKVKIN
tara:strand:- start:1102 stop:1263 length:162 start_codon:yes stop_codon:yes gene_type:complete